MVAYSTELPIRPDLDQAHAEVASRWSTTCSWWSGVERLAIVEAVRVDNGGRATGITLKSLHEFELTNPNLDETIITHSLFDRTA